jgi:putative transposase
VVAVAKSLLSSLAKKVLFLHWRRKMFVALEKKNMMKKTNTNWKAVDTIIAKYKDGKETDSKDHFRFGKLECYELAKVRSTRHARYNINYHFVWIPKTRSKVMQERVARTIKDVTIQVCKQHEWIPLALEVMPDHIHLFLSAPPKWAPAVIIKNIKGNVSRQVRLMFQEFKQYREKELWADSYYCGTAGHVSQEQVIRYIAEQEKNLNVKPFSYSVFSKEQKTLADFSVS